MRSQLRLELAAEHDLDLILLDLHVPDMPGQEVLRRLRAQARTAPCRWSCWAPTPARPDHGAADPGGTGVPDQPLDVKELLELIDTVAAERTPAG